MFDVILMGVAALLQLAVTVFSVDIAVRDNRKRNALIIGIGGGIAIALTIWAAYDAYVVQDQLTRDVASVKKQLSGAVVNLSYMQLFPEEQRLSPDKEIAMQIAFTVREGTAKHLQCWFNMITLPGEAVGEQNRKAISMFRTEMATEDQPNGADMTAGAACYHGESVRLKENELAELVEVNGKARRTIYALGFAKWKNDAGAQFDTGIVCAWMEPPKVNILLHPGWHDCSN